MISAEEQKKVADLVKQTKDLILKEMDEEEVMIKGAANYVTNVDLAVQNFLKEEQAKKRKREAELKKVEARIEELETRDSEIDETMVLPEVCTNVAECTKLSREKAAIAEELEELYEKWEELA